MIDHLTTREQEIIEILKKDPMISQDELAEKLKISRSSVAVHISNLMRKGYIAGRGYIFDEHSGILVVGRSWLEIRARAGSGGSDNSEAGSIEFACGGNGCLLALELARHQLEPALVTFLGQDEIGDQIYNHLLQRGINVKNIIRNVSASTAKRLILSDSQGTFRLVKDGEDGLSLDQDAVSAKEELIKTAKILLIDGELPLETLSYLASGAISHGIVSTVVNCPLTLLRELGLLSHPQFILVYQAVDLTAQSSIVPAAEPEELFPLCRQILAEGCHAVVVMFGDQGLILATGEETVYLPASPLQAPGTTLSVAAGIAEGLASGYRMRMAVRMAMGSG